MPTIRFATPWLSNQSSPPPGYREDSTPPPDGVDNRKRKRDVDDPDGVMPPAPPRRRRAAVQLQTFEQLLVKTQDYLTPGVLPRLVRRLAHDAQHLPPAQQVALWSSWVLSYTHGYTRVDFDALDTAANELQLLVGAANDPAVAPKFQQALLSLIEERSPDRLETWVGSAQNTVRQHLQWATPKTLCSFLHAAAERVLSPDAEVIAWLTGVIQPLGFHWDISVLLLAQSVCARFAECADIKAAADVVGTSTMRNLHHTAACNYAIPEPRASGEIVEHAQYNLALATRAITDHLAMPAWRRSALQTLNARMREGVPLQNVFRHALNTARPEIITLAHAEAFIARSEIVRPMTARLSMRAGYRGPTGRVVQNKGHAYAISAQSQGAFVDMAILNTGFGLSFFHQGGKMYPAGRTSFPRSGIWQPPQSAGDCWNKITCLMESVQAIGMGPGGRALADGLHMNRRVVFGYALEKAVEPFVRKGDFSLRDLSRRVRPEEAKRLLQPQLLPTVRVFNNAYRVTRVPRHVAGPMLQRLLQKSAETHGDLVDACADIYQSLGASTNAERFAQILNAPLVQAQSVAAILKRFGIVYELGPRTKRSLHISDQVPTTEWAAYWLAQSVWAHYPHATLGTSFTGDSLVYLINCLRNHADAYGVLSPTAEPTVQPEQIPFRAFA